MKHRKKHRPAPRWGACGLQHQCGALRSMLSFIQSSVSSLLCLNRCLQCHPRLKMMAEPQQFSLHYSFQVLYILHTLLFISLEMAHIPIWSKAPYVRPRQVCDYIFQKTVKVESRGDRMEVRFPEREKTSLYGCSSVIDPIKPFTSLWSKVSGQSHTKGQRLGCRSCRVLQDHPERIIPHRILYSQQKMSCPFVIVIVISFSCGPPPLHSIIDSAEVKNGRFQ